MTSLDKTPLMHLKTTYHPQNALWMAKIAKAVYIRKGDGDEAPDIDKIISMLKVDDAKFVGGVGYNINSAQGAIIQHEDYLVVAFRGTDEAADWLDNINVLPKDGPLGTVHAGFHHSLMDIWPAMKSEIRKIRTHVAKEREAQGLPRRSLPLWITGHSFGAAMATLAAAHMIEADEPFFGLYTFGSPRCGDRTFARTYNVEAGKRTFRFQNNNDISNNSRPS